MADSVDGEGWRKSIIIDWFMHCSVVLLDHMSTGQL